MAKFSVKAPLASLDEYLYTELNEEPLAEDNETTDHTNNQQKSGTEEEDDTNDDNERDEHSLSDDNDQNVIELNISGRLMYLRRHRIIFCSLKYSLFFFNYVFWLLSQHLNMRDYDQYVFTTDCWPCHHNLWIVDITRPILEYLTSLLVIVGLVIITCGSWILHERTKLASDISDFILDPAISICVFGIIMVLITFIGCLGSIRENILLLKIFHYSLSIVLFLELILLVIVVIFYQTPSLRKYIHAIPEDIVKNAIRGYHDDEHLKEWMDLLQTELKCCGFSYDNYGYKDWQMNMYHNCTADNKSSLRCTVPMSCCIMEKGDFINTMCGFSVLNQDRVDIMNRIYTIGCMKELNNLLRRNNTVIIFTTFGIIISQICSVILGRILIRYILKQRARSRRLL